MKSLLRKYKKKMDQVIPFYTQKYRDYQKGKDRFKKYERLYDTLCIRCLE